MSARAVSDLERDDQRVPHRVTIDLLADALKLAREDRMLLEAAARRGRSQRPAAHEGATLVQTLPTTDDAAPEPTPTASTPAAPLEPPTPFIGRERDEAAVTHLLRRDDVRLLTLTGPEAWASRAWRCE